MSDTEIGTASGAAASAAPDRATLQRANLLADLLESKVAAAGRRIDIDPERVQRGLGQLVLTVVKLLHVLLERQAIRRVDGGDLDEEEIEQLGLALMRQSEEIERLRRLLGLEDQDLNLDLGPLGKLF
jgi:hypothetical protein